MIVAAALVLVLVVVAAAASVAAGDRAVDGFASVAVVLTVLVIGGIVVVALGAGIDTGGSRCRSTWTTPRRA